MRSPFQKNINSLAIEEAHGGSGRRQLLLSGQDSISSQLQAMTKGFLKPGGVFDWHQHECVDEFFLVLRGRGTIQFENSPSLNYSPDDLVYIPANVNHRIENTATEENEFYFVRVGLLKGEI